MRSEPCWLRNRSPAMSSSSMIPLPAAPSAGISRVSPIALAAGGSGGEAEGSGGAEEAVSQGADAAQARIIGYAASRAHHADVGGIEPGSMPAASKTLAEEGVVIPPTRLVAAESRARNTSRSF